MSVEEHVNGLTTGCPPCVNSVDVGIPSFDDEEQKEKGGGRLDIEQINGLVAASSQPGHSSLPSSFSPAPVPASSPTSATPPICINFANIPITYASSRKPTERIDSGVRRVERRV